MVHVITDDKLELHGERVKGAVVIITGAGSGIGQTSAYNFASRGAKVIVSDLNLASAQATVDEISSRGGEAIAVKCDVLSYEEQLSTFKAAIDTFGSVDVVVVNAGIAEGSSLTVPDIKDNAVVKLRTLTLDVNLTGALYTIYLAQHYLTMGQSSSSGKLKSLVIISSITAFYPIMNGPLYVAAKLGLVGLLKSLQAPLASKGVRTSLVNPWFTPTALMNDSLLALLAGIALTPTSRIANAVVNAASDPNTKTTGSVYALLDDGPVHLFSQEDLCAPDLYMALGRACNIQEELKPQGIASPTSRMSINNLQIDASRFKDAVVLIMGASSIGHDAAILFAQHGANIVVVDHDTSALDKVVTDVRIKGCEAISVKCDISSFDEQQAAFKAAIDRFGVIDIVVFAVEDDHNQSFGLPILSQGEVGKPNLDTIHMHVFGALYCMHLAYHYLKIGNTSENPKRKTIITMAAPSPNQPIPGSALYMTSKLAQLGMIRSVDRVSAKIGVNLAIVSPVLPNGVAPDALADTIVYAAAETSLSQAGVSYSLTAEDAGSVRVALQDTIREGVFGELSARMDKIYGLQPMIPR